MNGDTTVLDGSSKVYGRMLAVCRAVRVRRASGSAKAGSSTSWPEGSDAQLAFYLDEPLAVGVPLTVYFDIINLSTREPSGELSIAGLEWTCETRYSLATIELAKLSPTETWQTRCVELTPAREFSVFGIWVTGPDFAIGLDTFRFGPPCR